MVDNWFRKAIFSSGTGTGADCFALRDFTNPFLTLRINSLKEVRTIVRRVIKNCS